MLYDAVFYSICSDRAALDRRSSIQDSTNRCLEHPQSWSPKNLTVCSRLITVLPPALKIEDLPYFLFENLPSWSPQQNCKEVNNNFPPWPNAGSASAHPQFDSDNVHSRSAFWILQSALRATQDLKIEDSLTTFSEILQICT